MNCEPVNYESIHVTHDKDYQTKRNEQMVRRIRQGLRQFYKVCKFAKGQTGVLMLDDWWSLSLPFSSPLIGTLKLAGTRRDSQGLAGTRREHWNSQELAGTRRIFGTLEHWYSAVAWPPGLADGRRRWQSRVEAWYTWHRMVEWQSRRDRAVAGGGGGRGMNMGKRGKLER